MDRRKERAVACSSSAKSKSPRTKCGRSKFPSTSQTKSKTRKKDDGFLNKSAEKEKKNLNDAPNSSLPKTKDPPSKARRKVQIKKRKKDEGKKPNEENIKGPKVLSKKGRLKSSSRKLDAHKKGKTKTGRKPSKQNKMSGTTKTRDLKSSGSDPRVSPEDGSRKSRKRKKSGDHSSGSKKKRSRTQEPISMTTRLMSAKKVGVTRFTFDNVCNCDEKGYHVYVNSVKINYCPCGKRFEHFMKLIGKFESDPDKATSPSEKQNLVKNVDFFNMLSIEMICYLFKFLSLREVLLFESMSKKLQKSVQASLLVKEKIDFHEEVNDRRLFEDNLPTMTDYMFTRLLEKLPKLRYIYNFHPVYVSLLRSSDGSRLSAPGVTDAIMSCKSLEGVEISNMALLEYLVSKPGHPKILGKFQNRDGRFPVPSGSMTVLKEESRITNLHLVGCSLCHLPQMDGHLEHLYLRMVKFVHPHPFKNFSAIKLKTFVMSHCIGPSSALKYIPLLTALADAWMLNRLELQRVPFLGEVIQHVCEDNWKDGGFRRLESVSMGQCKNAVDADLGFLIIAAAAHLELLRIQPSLTKDSLFNALAISDVRINPGFEELHLGWQETMPFHETMTPEEQLAQGLADLPESHSRLTDAGMRLVGQCFPPLKKLDVRRCPHLINPLYWITPGQHYLRQIQELTLQDCHSLRIEKFCAFLTFLPELRYLTLREIFKEPPVGCSRVGLSAGTGLGMSSALINPHPVANNDGAQNVGNNRNQAEDDGIDNVAANQEQAEVNPANGIADAEFELQNGRYNLRHSFLRRESSRSPEQGPSMQNIDRNNPDSRTRRSSRLKREARSNMNEHDNTNQANCDNSNSANDEASTSRSGLGAEGQGSGRGKALVTKKGLVSRVKSSKGLKAENGNEEKIKVEKVCTCVKQSASVGCQASNDDIRNTMNGGTLKRRSSSRNSKNQGRQILPGNYTPASASVGTLQSRPRCEKHRYKLQYRPEMVDKCDSTNDPVWEEDHTMVLMILHRRLEYLKLDAVGITELNIICYNLQVLSISRCRVLKEVNLKEAPFLENVHVSQCKKIKESNLLDEIYRLTPHVSKFVSLRPMHPVDQNLYHDLMFLNDLSHYSSNYGTVMMFDHSDQPTKTNYNKLRMRSWIHTLEKMSRETERDHGWMEYSDMDVPNKLHTTMEGKSCDGSKWELLADVPWIYMLDQCPDMEDSNIKNPEWKKEGVYCSEAKGHFSFWDAYSDVHDFIYESGPSKYGLYPLNVITYINTCDMSGVPCKDAMSIL